MKAQDKTRLIAATENLLQLKGLQASQELQIDSLKTIIMDIAKKYPDEFMDGELKLDGVALLKYVNNPMKLVYIESGEAISDKDVTNLMVDLEAVYCSTKTTLNMSRLKMSVENNDKKVIKLLKQYKLKLNATQRIDVKAA